MEDYSVNNGTPESDHQLELDRHMVTLATVLINEIDSPDLNQSLTRKIARNNFLVAIFLVARQNSSVKLPSPNIYRDLYINYLSQAGHIFEEEKPLDFLNQPIMWNNSQWNNAKRITATHLNVVDGSTRRSVRGAVNALDILRGLVAGQYEVSKIGD